MPLSNFRTNLLVVLSTIFFTSSFLTLQAQSRVPFVGCAADGQAGPLDPPNGSEISVSIASDSAQKLAYYKAEQGFGVLAPRGWFCFEIYGSNGGTLYVSPQPIRPDNLFSDKWVGFTGPVVELSTSIGDTSGRFGVAWMIAKVFPAHLDFVNKIIQEGLESTRSFQYGPYPHDKLNYKSSELVEFLTPANSEGLGTTSRIRKNAELITGFAYLIGPTPDLIHLSLRLPSNLRPLAQEIVKTLEENLIAPH